MAAEPFVPLLSDVAINVFIWIFTIISLGSIVWYILYLNSNRDNKLKTSMKILLLAAFVIAIDIQLIFLKFKFIFF